MKALAALIAVLPCVVAQDAGGCFRNGMALARQGNLDAARSTFEDCRRRFPTDKRFPTELAGIAYKRGDTVRARGFLVQALDIAPDDAYANDFLGTLYLLEGNLEAALGYWNRIGKPLIGNVTFVPQPGVDPALLARTFEISPGQVLTLERLRYSQANAARLEAFSDCRFELAPSAAGTFRLIIRTTPRSIPAKGWLGKLAPFARGLPYQQVNFDFFDVRQRAIRFSSLARWDPDKRRLLLDYSAPLGQWRYHWVADGRDETWDLRPSYRAASISGLKLERIEVGADLSRLLNARIQWTVGIRAAQRSFAGGDGSGFFASGWSFDLRNRIDARLRDWSGHRAHTDAWGALRTGQILSPDRSRLMAVEGGIRTVWLPGLYAFTNETQGGAISGSAPLDELYLLGMERDTGLWMRGHVGTRDGRKGNSPLGRNYALIRNTAERTLFRLPLVTIGAGPFFDVGRTGDPSGRFGSRGWLYDTGVQATVATLGGIRFTAVYGRNLRDGGGVFYTSVTR